MNRQEQRQEAHDREQVLRARREALEADLTHVAALIETESAEGSVRRGAVQGLRQQLEDATDEDADETRMAWYLAAYEDAQHTIVVTQGLMQRYNEIARALTSCQRELMQLSRDHRRG